MNRPTRWQLALRVVGLFLACGGAFYQLSLLIRLFAGRVRYPWDVEWLESAALYQALRVKQGLYTYGPFRDGYIALNHPPGYPTLLGLLGRVFGLDYAMARTVSMLFFLSAAALVVRALVRHQQGKLEGWALGAFAVGTAAAGTPVFGSFYDLVREDVMAVFLATLGAVLVDGPAKMRPRRMVAVVLVITAIVYTRQPAVFFPVWIVLYAFLRHRRTGFFLALGAAASCGLVLVAIQFASKGWYWMLTIGLMQNHRVHFARFVLGLQTLHNFAPFLVAIPIIALGLAARRKLSASAGLWVGMLIFSLPAALLPFAKVGGFINDFMPTVFFAGPAAAFVASDLLRALEKWPLRRAGAAAALFAAGAVYLGLRHHDIKRLLPTEAHFKKAAALNAKIAGLKGGVISPRHPFTPGHNRHRTLNWSDMPYLDMVWSGYTDLNLGGYIDKSKARWAVIMGNELGMTLRELSTRYQLEERLVDSPVTVLGERSQLRYLLRLKDSEEGARVLFDFEKNLDGWTQSGDTFRLTSTRPSWQSEIVGAVGGQVVNSYHPDRRDAAKGTLTSPRFVIDRPHMALRVGGSHRSSTRVELRVGGQTERTTHGIFENTEAMIKVVWDVAPFLGKEAELVLLDQDATVWGHLTVDQVILY